MRNALKSADRFKFMKLVEVKYKDAKVSDAEFAKIAEAELGFKVTAANVGGARDALNIASSTPRGGVAMEAAIVDLQARVKALETFMALTTKAAS